MNVTLLKPNQHKYHGSFATLVGQFMHIVVWTCNDVGIAICRLTCYTPAPSVFRAILRFLEIQFDDMPITIYQDSQPTIDTIASRSITSWAKHIAVYYLY